jgi:acyl-CoA thioesterase
MVVRPYFTADKHVLPFDKVIELERIDDTTFRSIVKAYSPTGGENGTYGGHVFAQAAWAAAQTVKEGFLIHVCHVVGRVEHYDLILAPEHHGMVFARR